MIDDDRNEDKEGLTVKDNMKNELLRKKNECSSVEGGENGVLLLLQDEGRIGNAMRSLVETKINGMHPLEFAAVRGKERSVRCLLDHEEKPGEIAGKTNKEGKTALQCVLGLHHTKQYEKCAKLLLANEEERKKCKVTYLMVDAWANKDKLAEEH